MDEFKIEAVKQVVELGYPVARVAEREGGQVQTSRQAGPGSTAFLKEYVDNLSRIGSLIQFAEERQAHLETLETTLSASLAFP